ncbi:group-specific protein [Paenibacillus sp. FSL L8-0708]|uniref:group-specific protein n=1 Tax=Paenibacillus sp. FSL L8-0708 TaxID=2975311 RepID=UPI0030FC3796
MLDLSINESQVRKILLEQIEKIVKEVDSEHVFWDTNELKKRTCMSWNFIQEQFFFDSRFPKRKIGTKWFFPAKETRKFLELWLDEQPK